MKNIVVNESGRKNLLFLAHELLKISCLFMFFALISDQAHWHQINYNFVLVLTMLLGLSLIKNLQKHIIITALSWILIILGLLFVIQTIHLYFLILCIFLSLIYRMRILFARSEADRNQVNILASIRYIAYLIPMIYLSCWETAMCIWGRRGVINTYVAWLHLSSLSNTHDSRLRNFITAHSITLTPGTLVLQLDKNKILVHALNTWSWRSLQDNNWHEKIYHIFNRNQTHMKIICEHKT